MWEGALLSCVPEEKWLSEIQCLNFISFENQKFLYLPVG